MELYSSRATGPATFQSFDVTSVFEWVILPTEVGQLQSLRTSITRTPTSWRAVSNDTTIDIISVFGASKMDSTEESTLVSFLLLMVTATLALKRRNRRHRSMYVRPIFTRRESHGAYSGLVTELRDGKKNTTEGGRTRLAYYKHSHFQKIPSITTHIFVCQERLSTVCCEEWDHY